MVDTLIPVFVCNQGVHDSRGVHEDYLKLESLVQKVVSPYLGTHGLYTGDGSDTHCCVLGEKVLPYGNNDMRLRMLADQQLFFCAFREVFTVAQVYRPNDQKRSGTIKKLQYPSAADSSG